MSGRNRGKTGAFSDRQWRALQEVLAEDGPFRLDDPAQLQPGLAFVQRNSIKADPLFQVRVNGLDAATVARYVKVLENGEEFAERIVIGVVEHHGVKYGPFLIDGFHRLEAYKHARLSNARGYPVPFADIPVEVREYPSLEVARSAAAKANLQHGLPLKKADLRRVLHAMIAAGEHLQRGNGGKVVGLRSYRELAKLLGGGVTHNTVRNWIKADYPRLFRQMGGDPTPEAIKGGLPDAVQPAQMEAQYALELLRQVSATLDDLRDDGWRERVVVELRSLLRTHGSKRRT